MPAFLKNQVLPLILLSTFSQFPIFLSAQNVGIGTSTPIEKLHVEGNILMDTAKLNAILLAPNAGIGKILTSDDAGNATWENLIIPPSENNNGNVGYGVWGDCATNGNISEYNPVADTAGVIWDNFGLSVSISGNYAIAGAIGYIGIGTAHQGFANVYEFNGHDWVFMEKLSDANGNSEDQFGYSVCVSGSFAIVGSLLGDGPAGINIGSASIYQFNGSNWELMEKITDAEGGVGDHFGISVAISGDYAIIGADEDDGVIGSNQGSASIYHFDGSNWTLMQKITDDSGAANDYFGYSVAISGEYAVVGSYQDDGVIGSNQGSASIYQFDGSNWILMQKITDSQGGANDFFGCSVSISDNYTIVGAYNGNGVSGDPGTASIFKFNGASWSLMQRIRDVNGVTLDKFGVSVSISGNYAIIGANSDDGVLGQNQGSASIYTRLGNNWQRLQYVTDPNGDDADLFGQSTAIDGLTKRFIIGVPHYLNYKGKAVFGKVN